MAVNYCQLNGSKRKDHRKRYMARGVSKPDPSELARRRVHGAPGFFCRQPLFELHVSAAASRIDSNAVLRGRNADYHTGLI
jgi:hypothetical protein